MESLQHNLSYIPLIGPDPDEERRLVFSMHKDQATNLKKRVKGTHISFTRKPRWEKQEKIRKLKKRSLPKCKNQWDEPAGVSLRNSQGQLINTIYRQVPKTGQIARVSAFEKKIPRFPGMPVKVGKSCRDVHDITLDSSFCLGDHTLGFSSVSHDTRAWRKHVYMDKKNSRPEYNAIGKGIGMDIMIDDLKGSINHTQLGDFKQSNIQSSGRKAPNSFKANFDSDVERMPWPKARSPDPNAYKHRYSRNQFSASTTSLPRAPDLQATLEGKYVLKSAHGYGKADSQSPRFDKNINSLFMDIDDAWSR